MKLKRIRNHGYGSGFPRIEPQGDAALLVRMGDAIDLQINRRVQALSRALEEKPVPGYIESIPGYCTLLVNFDPLVTDDELVEDWVFSRLKQLRQEVLPKPHLVEIPVMYGGEYGPDLDEVAGLHRIMPDEVIQKHCSREYTVFFIGFLPGFPYLGGMDESIATPRLATPRPLVKAGSVGIAGAQTGIYPQDSPGGWRIIGWTPLRLFDPLAAPPALLSPGDTVRFVPSREPG